MFLDDQDLFHQLLYTHTGGLEYLAEGIIKLIAVFFKTVPLIGGVEGFFALFGCGNLQKCIDNFFAHLFRNRWVKLYAVVGNVGGHADYHYLLHNVGVVLFHSGAGIDIGGANIGIAVVHRRYYRIVAAGIDDVGEVRFGLTPSAFMVIIGMIQLLVESGSARAKVLPAKSATSLIPLSR